jgi:hypothetical protein
MGSLLLGEARYVAQYRTPEQRAEAKQEQERRVEEYAKATAAAIKQKRNDARNNEIAKFIIGFIAMLIGTMLTAAFKHH